jgi:uncharacterized protein
MRRRFSLLLALALIASTLPFLAVAPALADSDADVVISQVYGGGGNSGATYTNDFIELYNRSDATVSLDGWSVQYGSSGGTTWNNRTNLSGTIEPGSYYLIQQAQGSGGTDPLPTPDATGTINMSATAGKVALVSATTALAGACPLEDAAIVDLVGFGGPDGVNCFEGTGPAPRLSNTSAALRLDDGAQDTDDNAADFIAGDPTPRNSSGEGVVPPPEPCEPDTYINEINVVGVNGLPNVANGMFGSTVSVEAVVTANFLAGLDGVFIQEEDEDSDDDPATSEGIFVYLPAAGDDDLAEGDLVCVTGQVGNFQGTYQLRNADYEIVESGVDLPTAVELVMPVGDRTELAQLAGMRVELTSVTGEMTITQNYFLGQYGELDLSAAGFLWHPAELYAPTTPEAEELRQDNLRALIKLDDANSTTNATPTAWLDNGDIRAGAVTTDTIEGVTHYQFGAYRVQPTDPDAITFVNTANPRPDGPPDVLAGAKKRTVKATVAAFNVLNYFTTLGSRGADTTEEFELQAAKIVTAITEMDADVVGLMEIENNFGGEGDALLDLVERLNAVAGPGTYAAIELKEPVGTDEISNAMIYQPDRVLPVGEVGIADHQEFVNPLGASNDRSRPAIAQAFEVESGEVFVAVVNHLKSKGTSCAEDGDPGDPIVGNCNLTRTLAAEELVRWLEEDDPTATGSDLIAIIGDLNAYAMEDPIEALRTGGYVDAFDEAPIYTYTFDGEHGRLDHAFVTSTLLDHVVDAAVWHINTDEPAAFDYNDWNDPANQDTSEFRSSDHDPVLVGLAFPQEVDDGRRGPDCERLPAQAGEKNPNCNDGDRPMPGRPSALDPVGPR